MNRDNLYRAFALILFLLGTVLALRAQQPTRLTVEVQGLPAGKGPDVLLIPGLASSKAVYADEAKLLVSSYRLHLVQIDGFAGAPAGPNATGPILEPVVEELHQYIVANHLHPAVIGHSLGGLLAMMLAQAHPEDVSKMLIVDTLPFYGLVFNPVATVELVKPQAQAMAAQMLAMPADQFAAMQPAIVSAMVKSPEGAKLVTTSSIASDRTVFVNAMLEDLATDIRPTLSAMKTPMTLLYPVDPARQPDAATVTALYTTAYSGTPNLKITRIDNSRHFIMYDQPAAFDAAVQAFLRS
ncbi:alpha/beta fold hydrolase [Granulicella sibirica]|uniref:Hydrolase, alpha/beta hydrolase fold family n=1 Tax=Granulicella sibirica TaxID=2479048 RepID=A0A4V1L5B3_9BACT|nr:alpha/beta hydrolase [Granulicella sibirica]RXH55164.1 Hydrolase, alpha/beta hydrolase fold family [Granulicella sibirica]